MTLEQTRASKTFRHVQNVKGKDQKFQDDYGGMALKLPALVRAAGLCQALHFVLSRKKPALDQLLDDLGEQMGRVHPAIKDRHTLCSKVREEELSIYLQLTREAVATLGWYARLARSELMVDPTQDTEG